MCTNYSDWGVVLSAPDTVIRIDDTRYFTKDSIFTRDWYTFEILKTDKGVNTLILDIGKNDNDSTRAITLFVVYPPRESQFGFWQRAKK